MYCNFILYIFLIFFFNLVLLKFYIMFHEQSGNPILFYETLLDVFCYNRICVYSTKAIQN